MVISSLQLGHDEMPTAGMHSTMQAGQHRWPQLKEKKTVARVCVSAVHFLWPQEQHKSIVKL